MSTHRNIDKLCAAAMALALVLTILLMNGAALGIQSVSRSADYADTLFDTSSVHTIDIVMDDWEGFLSTAQSEAYTLCTVVIDGKAVKNVGIRAKGNTSLSSVSSMNSDRYSFKLEFDHYNSAQSYRGLDKLCLNNIIQDNTYMKDYLVYQMMARFGVAAPLCSYAYLTVNGEDWGLYLAVEAVEESFLQRNYGSSYGQLYKPDSTSMGGSRGNGGEFQMGDLALSDHNDQKRQPDLTSRSPDRGGDAPPEASGFSGETPTDIPTPGEIPDMSKLPDIGDMPDTGGFGGMGSEDVKLQYIDDAPTSYANIFDNAKTSPTAADKARLIASLRQLSAYEDLEEAVDTETVLRYFVIHNYVVNDDSYTGSMIHNYYLYEEDGRLSMIPWDYNLAFGTFQGNSAASAVNDDIDAVLSDRPMQAWIFSDETYRQQYYALYQSLLEEIDVQAIIDETRTLIAPYVERDPTAFCTYEAFTTGVDTLKAFCTLRSESVQRQLSGSQEAVDVGALDLSDMGTMTNGMGGNRGGFAFIAATDSQGRPDRADLSPADADTDKPEQPAEAQMPDEAQTADGPPQLPDSENMTDSFQPPQSIQSDDSGQRTEDTRPSGDQQHDFTPEAPLSGSTASTGVLLAVSLLVLAVGLLTALLYRRRR